MQTTLSVIAAAIVLAVSSLIMNATLPATPLPAKAVSAHLVPSR